MALWPNRSHTSVPGPKVSRLMSSAAPGAGAAGCAATKSGKSAKTNNAPGRRAPARPRASGVAHMHGQLQHPARVGLGDAEHEAAEGDLLARFGQVAEFGRDHAADGVEFVLREAAAEALVEIGDRGERVDQEAAVGLRLDQLLARRIVLVVLVVDLADDLLEHVLDGDEPGHAAVLVDHDRHVIARQAKLLE